MEQENTEFFRAYNIRLKIKQQIIDFNQLVQRQATLMQQQGVLVQNNGPEQQQAIVNVQQQTVQQPVIVPNLQQQANGGLAPVQGQLYPSYVNNAMQFTTQNFQDSLPFAVHAYQQQQIPMVSSIMLAQQQQQQQPIMQQQQQQPIMQQQPMQQMLMQSMQHSTVPVQLMNPIYDQNSSGIVPWMRATTRQNEKQEEQANRQVQNVNNSSSPSGSGDYHQEEQEDEGTPSEASAPVSPSSFQEQGNSMHQLSQYHIDQGILLHCMYIL